ncbi:epsin-3-like [Coregonus clupeaformis]|uniref:epsin-3-like n=1 Tax=Coregonus clupeaformis TaxID=59861 RepID=UPI001E1C32B4|nr:epsin-3-like [Coregonus clupeaformis]
MAALYGEESIRSRGSPSSFNSSSSSPREASDLEQARPQTSGEEELQLQLALAMSREESEKCLHGNCVDDVSMPPLQDQLCLQGDESLLQRALDESRRDSHTGTGESAMLDLVDIFGSAEAPPPADDPWNAQPAVTSDWTLWSLGRPGPPPAAQPIPGLCHVSHPGKPATSSSSPVNRGWQSRPTLTAEGPDPFGACFCPQVSGREGPVRRMFDCPV